MYTQIDGVALALIAKAGIQSFTEASGDQWYMSNEQAIEFPTRVFFIRKPIDRLESCYSFLIGLKDEGAKQDMIPEEHLLTWQLFVDYILANSDEHWDPQTEQLLYKGILTPTHILKFEDVSNWWPNFFDVPLPHVNASIRLAVEDYRLEEINNFYSVDNDVWINATQQKDGATWPLP